MNRFKLKDIDKMKLSFFDRKINAQLDDFAALLLCEFYLDRMSPEDASSETYQKVKDYLTSQLISSSDIRSILKQKDNLMDVVKHLPDDGNIAGWKKLLSDCTIRILDDPEIQINFSGRSLTLQTKVMRFMKQNGKITLMRKKFDDAKTPSLDIPEIPDEKTTAVVETSVGQTKMLLMESPNIPDDSIVDLSDVQTDAILHESLDIPNHTIINLSEIEDLRINIEDRKLRPQISDFMALFLCEYAIGYLGLDEKDSAVYSAIRRYLFEQVITKMDLLSTMEKNQDLKKVITLFPSFEDKSGWQLFFDESTWELENDNNRFIFKGHVFEQKRHFLTLLKKENRFTIGKYQYQDDGYTYSSIVDDQIKEELENPYIFAYAKQPISSSGSVLKHLEVTDEDFFSINNNTKLLDEDQRKAVRYDEEKNLILLAGAGSGKTRTLVTRLAYLHVVKNIDLDKIILMTFNRETAYELKEKGTEIIRAFYEKYSDPREINVNARSIDSFIRYLISNFWFEMGFSKEPEFLYDNRHNPYKNQSVLQVIHENGMDYMLKRYDHKKIYSEVENLIAGKLNPGRNIEVLITLLIEKQKQENKVYGFKFANLLINRVLDDKTSGLKDLVARNFSHILIDEFQDLDRVQNKTFEFFYYTPMNFTIVGDDDQAIYGWRGSDNAIIQNLSENSSHFDTMHLLTNYRNNPNIVNAGNIVLQHVKGRAKDGQVIIAKKETGPKIRVSSYDEKYLKVTREIERLIHNEIMPGEICILARTKEELKQIRNTLEANNIQVKVDSETDANDSYYKFLKGIINVFNDNDLRNSCHDIKNFVAFSTAGVKSFDPDIISNEAIKNVILELGEPPRELAALQQLSNYLRHDDIENLSDFIEAFIFHSKETFHPAEQQLALAGDFLSHVSNLNAAWPIGKKQLNDIYRSFESRYISRKTKNTGSGGVVLNTMHQAKGLEFNTVFILGLAEGTIPNTGMIDWKYQQNLQELKDIAVARSDYNALRQENRNDAFLGISNACDGDYFDKHEQKELLEFKKELLENRRSILNLEADGIEAYIEIYQYRVEPLMADYERTIKLANMDIGKLISEFHQLDETLLGLRETDDSEVKEQLGLQKKELSAKLQEANTNKSRKEYLRSKFADSIAPLTAFYRSMLYAKNLLVDISRLDELEELIERLKEERDKSINEETRLYYVSITRAIEQLYLCYPEHSTKSSFIEMIDDRLKGDYILLSKEQEKELLRLSSFFKEPQADNITESPTESAFEEEKAIDEILDNIAPIFDKTGYGEYFMEKMAQVKERQPIFSHLSPRQDELFTKAIRLVALQELTDIDFAEPFVQQMKKLAELALKEYVGGEAKPFKTEDPDLAHRIIEDIRNIAKQHCVTNSPNPKYLLDLLTRLDRYSEEMEDLKKLGVMNYIVRSNRYGHDASLIADTWENSGPIDNYNQFLAATIDLANIRNDLIHNVQPSSEEFANNPIPKVFDFIEVILKNSVVEE